MELLLKEPVAAMDTKTQSEEGWRVSLDTLKDLPGKQHVFGCEKMTWLFLLLC